MAYVYVNVNFRHKSILLILTATLVQCCISSNTPIANERIGVCVDHIWVMKNVTEEAIVNQTVLVESNCTSEFDFRTYICYEEKIIQRPVLQIVVQKVKEPVEVCCEGWVQEEGIVGHIICTPVCEDVCVHGKCVAPNTCRCDRGFRKTRQEHVCEPLCGCFSSSYGVCIIPKVCRQMECVGNKFYNERTNECEEICTPSCVNGYCVNQNECKCSDGYNITDLNEPHFCKPICENMCVNSDCIEPNKCSCLNGYIKKNNDQQSSVCVPYCSNHCTNGECIAPEICKCKHGYKPALLNSHLQRNENDSLMECIPHCSKGCINGNCISPELCLCAPDYELKNINGIYTCIPVKKYCLNDQCHNGFCINNTCICYKGYTKSPFDKYTCINICENCAINNCTKYTLDECKCFWGFEKQYNDVFDNYKCVINQKNKPFNFELLSLHNTLFKINETCFGGFNNMKFKFDNSSKIKSLIPVIQKKFGNTYLKCNIITGYNVTFFEILCGNYRSYEKTEVDYEFPNDVENKEYEFKNNTFDNKIELMMNLSELVSEEQNKNLSTSVKYENISKKEYNNKTVQKVEELVYWRQFVEDNKIIDEELSNETSTDYCLCSRDNQKEICRNGIVYLDMCQCSQNFDSKDEAGMISNFLLNTTLLIGILVILPVYIILVILIRKYWKLTSNFNKDKIHFEESHELQAN